ncbi:pteridine reductase [Lysobacter niastensis]|uniref:Pteridine reductase n=1 Tax=Lysobacter niastensis TaxID=380629 RepID=A0ABS0BAF2_9GAMM|nr:pteridine reductase [Lysobacter niastensis]MBF6025263.1 pteridine reductase [Lysobacter niastensis]
MPAASSHPVVLVTGAARRIGAAIARTLHGAGYDIALHHRHSERDAQALADELEARRAGSTLLLQADLVEFDRIPELIAHTVGRFGRLDALVNNASTFVTSPLGTTTPALWDEVLASNARAPFFLAQAAMPHLQARRGAIVNITDIYGERPLRDHAVYCMAKAALLMMTRSLALELGPGVRVNAVSPGAILWPQDSSDTAAQQAMLARTPLGRTGTPEEVAEAVRWLLQDAHYSTGQVLHLDGGRMLTA